MSDLHALISALPNPTIVVGHDSRISGINTAAQMLLGKDCDGWNYITALRQPALLEAIKATIKDKERRCVRFLGNDGVRETTWNVTVSTLNTQVEPAILLSFDDITALEDADEMRRVFVGNVSHELRTPLTSLVGFIETLRGPARNDPDAQDRFLGIMEQEAGRMHRLVEDLLSLSRVEGQERIRPTQTVSLNDLIHDVTSALAPVAKAQDVIIALDLPEPPTDILGDREQLWQVISNLVENAIKYGGRGKVVTVRMTPAMHDAALMKDGVRVSVIDQGDGIPAHHIARLTERFYRVDSHRSREVGGTGLGLAIVKHIITRHRGRLKILSEMEQGSEFIALLPLGTHETSE